MAGGGGDAIMRPFILILSFTALCGMLLVAFADVFAEHATLSAAEDLPDNLFNVFGDWSITAYTPSGSSNMITTDGKGYNVTNNSVYSKVPDGETGGLPFDGSDKRVYVVRDNEYFGKKTTHDTGNFGTDKHIPKAWSAYHDFIGIKRKSDDYLGGKVHRFAVPLDLLVKNFDDETNTSRYDFPLSGSNYTLFLILCDNNTQRIYWNNYSLYLGSSMVNQKTNFWGAIKMLYTGTIPDCNYYLNKMIQAIVVFSSIFLVYEMITRALPF